MVHERWIRHFMAVALMALLSFFFVGSAWALQEPNINTVPTWESFYIKADADLLSDAKANARVITNLPMGSCVRLIASDGTWAIVQYQQRQGFVRCDHLSDVYPTLVVQLQFPRAAYVLEGTYLHKEGRASSKIVARLGSGVELEVQSIENGWAQVKVSDELSGYVLENRLTMFTPETERRSALMQGANGDEVKELQKRLKTLGYLKANATGAYRELTFEAIKNFQEVTGLTPTGQADTDTLFVLFNESAPKYRTWTLNFKDFNEYFGLEPEFKVIKADWWKSNIRSVFSVGDTALVTDVRTGIQFKVWRGGGSKHADVQPVSASDTRKMKRACGGYWSWARRPIWVTIGGNTYAASMNCMNHGEGSISGNKFDGHFCIHFTNSRTHGGNRVCPLHQACINEAYAAGNK